jgi:protein phosphatase 2C family protein 2/3
VIRLHACRFCKQNLHQKLVTDPNYPSDIKKAFHNAFLKTDEEFLKVCRAKRLDAGCTAIAILISHTSIVVANAGDCRCILSRKGQLHVLSNDHKPYDPVGRRRIEKAGSTVEDNRVDGRLAVSRAIGDVSFKVPTGSSSSMSSIPTLRTSPVLSLLHASCLLYL